MLVAIVLTGCSSGSSTESGSNLSTASQTQTSTPVDMNVTALKGPTAMGMVKFMNDCEEETITDNNYNFSIAASIDEVTPKLYKVKLTLPLFLPM